MKRSIVVICFMVLGIIAVGGNLLYSEEGVKQNEIYTEQIPFSDIATLGFIKQENSSIQPHVSKVGHFRNKIGFEASTGIQGIMSFVQLGILFPRINDTLFIDLKVKYMSSLTWATYIDQDGNAVSFHPAVIGGAVSFGGYSPLIYNSVRMYGGVDLFLGYSFTPYDSAIFQTGNLIGDNLTFALWGFFGLEFFTSEHISLIIDAGGGFKSLIGDKSNQYVIASSWLGSGFGIKMGIRYYL
jgi:hypothetical protein